MALIPTVLTQSGESLNVRRSVCLNFFAGASSGYSAQTAGVSMLARSCMWASKKSTGTVRIFYMNASGSGTDVSNQLIAFANANLPVTFTFADSTVVGTSALNILNYDVCIATTNGSPDSTWAGPMQTFAAAGGGIIITAFSNFYHFIPGFSYTTYTPINDFATNTAFNNPSMNTSTIVTHPITVGLSSLTFNPGTFSTTINTLAPGAQSLVLYDNGALLVSIKSVSL